MATSICEGLARLSLEEYIEIKNIAYQFYQDKFVGSKQNNQHLERIISEYQNEAFKNFPDNSRTILFTSTVIIPYDFTICRYYHEGENFYENYKKENPVFRKILEIKEFEIEHFGMLELLAKGVLVPPIQDMKKDLLSDIRKNK